MKVPIVKVQPRRRPSGRGGAGLHDRERLAGLGPPGAASKSVDAAVDQLSLNSWEGRIMKVVDVAVPADLNQLYCPVCGQKVFDIDDDENQPKCKHLVFVHLDLANEFVYASPACKQVVTEAEKAASEDDVDPIQYVLDHIDSSKQSSVLCFSTTSCGICCGPCSSTLCVAIDFDPDGEEAEDDDEDEGEEGGEEPAA
jgi:hypothetical protein